MALNLARNSRVFFTTNVDAYGKIASGGFTSDNTYEIQVLDGFTFSQNTTQDTVTLSEAGGNPVRGQRSFNTALAPADFSMSTYLRPYNATTAITAEESVLWNALLDKDAITNSYTVTGTNTVTAVSTGGVLTLGTAATLTAGTAITFPVAWTGTGITAGATYYVTTDTTASTSATISATSGGSAISLTTALSGISTNNTVTTAKITSNTVALANTIAAPTYSYVGSTGVGTVSIVLSAIPTGISKGDILVLGGLASADSVAQKTVNASAKVASVSDSLITLELLTNTYSTTALSATANTITAVSATTGTITLGTSATLPVGTAITLPSGWASGASGLTAGTTYYVKSGSGTSYVVSATPGGSAVTTSAVTGINASNSITPVGGYGMTITAPTAGTYKVYKSAWAPVTATTSYVSTGASDLNQLQAFGMIFAVDNVVYTLDNCAMTQVSIDFGLDGIATAAWSGQGTQLNESTITVASMGFKAKQTAAPFITNKLSTATLTLKNALGSVAAGTSYTVALTGGNITINNNINYITPANLATVNVAQTYYTGTRAISGTLNAYLKTGSGVGGTGQLLKDMLANITTQAAIEPMFNLTLAIGGTSSTAPARVELEMPSITLTVPTVDVQQVISTAINFTAEGLSTASNANAFAVDVPNELAVRYYAA
jgi:hypothetical protein